MKLIEDQFPDIRNMPNKEEILWISFVWSCAMFDLELEKFDRNIESLKQTVKMLQENRDKSMERAVE